MKNILGIIFIVFLTLQVQAETPSLKVAQKLIIGSSTNQASLDAVKRYCTQNVTLHALQEEHNFTITMEKLGEYNVTVIAPIDSITLRNTLFILLSPMFEDIFYVEQPLKLEKLVIEEGHREEQILWVYYGVGLQWMVLLCLSLIGLVLSIQNRRRVNQLIQSQNSLQVQQNKIESEIQILGKNNA
ncbi:MAG: hypothetical protein Q9M36_14895 [Sulfurovum sp.]|nr:hypothetical protein [Sulfurovum sp.]